MSLQPVTEDLRVRAILVVGYYHRHNLGDDAYETTLPLVLGTRHRYEFHCVDDVTTVPEVPLAWSGHDRWDLLVCGGGDVVNAYFLDKFAAIARAFDGPVWLFAAGVTYPAMIATDPRLDVFDRVFLRNAGDDLRAAERRFGTLRAHYLPDPAFALETLPPAPTPAAATTTAPTCGVFLMQSLNHPHSEPRARAERLRQIASCLEHVSRTHIVHLVRFNSDGTSAEDDQYINVEVRAMMVRELGVPATRVLLDTAVYATADAMLAHMASTFDIHVCMRFHAHIFSVIQHIPFVSFAITRKVRMFMRELGAPLSKMCTYEPARCPLDLPVHMDVRAFSARFDEVWARRDEVRAALQRAYFLRHRMVYTSHLYRRLLDVHGDERRPGSRPIRSASSAPASAEELIRDGMRWWQQELGFAPAALGTRAAGAPVHTAALAPHLSDVERRERAERVCERICFQMTGQVRSKYLYGFVQNMLNAPHKLNEYVHWVWNDFKQHVLPVLDGASGGSALPPAPVAPVQPRPPVVAPLPPAPAPVPGVPAPVPLLPAQPVPPTPAIQPVLLPVVPAAPASLPKFHLDFMTQDDFSGTHRCGWSYVWAGLHDAFQSDHGVLLDASMDRTFHWGRDAMMHAGLVPHTHSWVGFIHHTPDFEYSPHNVTSMFDRWTFRASLPTCRGIYVLSEHLAQWVRTELQNLGAVHVPVETLVHPTETVPLQFSMERFLANPQRSVVQVGGWLRNTFAIYDWAALDARLRRLSWPVALPAAVPEASSDDDSDDSSSSSCSSDDEKRPHGHGHHSSHSVTRPPRRAPAPSAANAKKHKRKRCHCTCSMCAQCTKKSFSGALPTDPVEQGAHLMTVETERGKRRQYSVLKAVLRGREMSFYMPPEDLYLGRAADCPGLLGTDSMDPTLPVLPCAPCSFCPDNDQQDIVDGDDDDGASDEVRRRRATNKWVVGLRAHVADLQKHVRILDRVTNDDYDVLLSQNLVFLNLFDASGCNALVECIVRNTPVFVNALPAVVEALGAGYPLYCNSVEEAATKARSGALIRAAHEYLKRMDKSPFALETFLRQVREGAICRNA